MKLLVAIRKEIETAVSNVLEAIQHNTHSLEADTAIAQAVALGYMDADAALTIIENDPGLTVKIRSELGSLLGRAVSARDFYNLAKNKQIRGEAMNRIAVATSV